MDVALLVVLILLNGVFAMSEMALTASRKARLQVMVESKEAGAAIAMELHDNPTRFLSTVQVGITSIGVLNGIVGEAAFAAPLAHWFEARLGMPGNWSGLTATATVVLLITILTIIFGVLVPKRLGQMHPESLARLMARPMVWLSVATRPLVWFLSMATDGVLRLLGLHRTDNRAVTEEEIAASLEEGVDAGVIEEQEHQMVRNVFRLDERQIGSMMIPRAEIVWLDVEAPLHDVLTKVEQHGHSRYPVCRGSLDDVVGVLDPHQLLAPLAKGQHPPLNQHVQPPVFVPETLSGMELLEHFRRANADLVFVVDEYGAVQGVVTQRDLLEAIAGEFTTDSTDDAWAVRREDGSWWMDGMIPVPEFKDRLEIKELPDEDRGRYNTLAGMVLLLLGRLPSTGDMVQWDGWRFEVADLDGKRVDKVWVSRLPPDHHPKEHP